MKYFRFIPVVVLLICATFPTQSVFSQTAPVAIVDTETVDEDAATTSIDVIANDTDADGDALTLTAVATAGTGTVAINSDGVSVDYTPAADFNGTEVITYTVSDGTDSDETGTLTVTVTSVNDAPVAVADTETVDEDAATTSIDVIANDTDADGDALTLTAVATAGTGTVAINSDGVSVDYTPAADFNGTEVITYTVSDGTDSDETGTLTVTVTSVNDAPVAVADTETVDEDAATTSIDVIANDTDADGDALTLTAVATAGTGTVAINSDGVSVDYTPAADFNGTEVITYTVSDGTDSDETGTLIVTVNPVNDFLPIAVADTETVDEDAATTSIDVIANDTDADGDALTLTAVATAGTGTVAINSDGVSVDYTPAADFNGTEVITYTVSDGTDSDETGTLTVTVTSVNDAPVAYADRVLVLENSTDINSFDVIANDIDVDGDALTLTAVATAGTGTVAINEDGVSVDYTPAADFKGTEVITYTVSDGTLTDETGTLTVIVNDDSREITALSSSSSSESETNGSFVITSIIDAESSVDVIIPLSFSGDAVLNQDYTVDFDTEGEETTLYNSGNSNYGKMKILPNGNYLFLEGTILRIYNPDDESLITKNLNNYYEGNIGIGIVSNTSFYAKINQGSIYKVDFSDLDAITETPHVALPSNSWVNSPFTLSGETLLYTVYNNSTGQRTQYKKEGNANSEIIGSINNDPKLVKINNNIYFINPSYYYEYVGEEITESTPYIVFENNFQNRPEKIEVFNNEIYTLDDQDNNQPGKLIISDNQASFYPLPVSEDSNIIYLDVNPNSGNLILQLSDFQNGIDLYTVSSYQLAPQLKIAAGNDSGTVTISGKSDELYELTESLIVQPGTPTNAVYNTSLTTNGIATPINLEITSDDSLPEATYAFSSPTIQEFPYEEVTLTATLSAVSGLDVIIPFTLSDNASTAVEVLSTEIVISAGQLTGSITVSTTEDLDDDDVEILEPIVFTFGTITNATSDVTDITLNLESDDDPTIIAIGTTGDETSQVEDGSFEITASINSASSSDVTIPMSFQGEAILDQDYTVSFDSQGEETQILDIPQNSNYGTMRSFPDGRLAFIDGSTLRIYDPVTKTLTSNYFDNYYGTNYQIATNTIIYTNYDRKLYKIDISDLNAITSEIIFNAGNLDLSQFYIADNGNTIYYSVQNYYVNDQNKIYKKVGDVTEEIYVGGESVYRKMIELNDDIYLIDYDSVYKLIDGNITYFNYIGNINGSSIININNVLYASKNQVPGTLDILTPYDIDNTSSSSFEPLPISEDDTIESFTIDPNSGNLYTINSGLDESFNSVRSISFYQIAPQLKISAGETSGTLTITGEDDTLYELTESLIVQPGTPSNASMLDVLLTDGVANPLTLEFTDNEELSEVTYAFSSPTIQEFPYEEVTLTATLSAVSGVDATIPFTLSDNAATAVEVSSLEIVIPAGELSGSITVSTTENLNDDDVEILEPIIFTFGTITNATSSTTDITLNLESDDDPTITAIGTTGDVTSQVEDGAFEITASINLPTSREVTIPFTFGGDAVFNEDYSVDFEGKDDSFLIKSVTSYRDFIYLDDGRIVVLGDNNRIYIYSSSGEEIFDTSIDQIENEYHSAENLIQDGNNIYFKGYQRVSLLNIETLEITPDVLPNLNGSNMSYLNQIDVINNRIHYITRDNNNYFKIQSKTLELDDIIVIAEGTGYPIDGFDGLVVDSNENIYYTRKDGIFIENENNQFVRAEVFNNGSFNINSIQIKNDVIYGKLYNYNNQTWSIVRFDQTLTTYQALNYNLEDGQQITDFSISDNGQLAISTNGANYNSKNIYGINATPKISILPGQTSGTFTISGEDDTLYEFTESLIVQAGTPVNGIFSDNLITEGVANPVTLELTDNDALSEVTYAFSSPTIQEFPYEDVTLTATLSAISGVDVIIPFTLSDNASTAVEVLSTEIVVLAGQQTGSITVSTTEDLDDDVVEILEPIVFTFGTISNATSEVTDITLNLESDDDPTITAIGTIDDITTQVEDGSFEITASINLPTSKEVTIPFTLSGDAIFNEDYTVSFDSEGEKSVVYDSGSQSFGKMKILPDGKYIFLEGQNLRIYNPEVDSLITKQLTHNYEANIGIGIVSNTSIYVKRNYPGYIYKIDFSDLDAISETPYISLQQNSWVPDPFTLSGETLYYTVYDNNSNQRTQFKKVGDADPEIIGTLNDGARIVDINGIIYFIGDSWFIEYEGEQVTSNDRIWFNMNNFRLNYSNLEVYNNEIYTLNQEDNNQPGKLSISGTQVSFSPLPVSETASINYLDIDSTTGNLILQVYEYANSNNSYTVNSYQLAPQLKIAAGETTGMFTLIGKDDDLFELAESLVVLPSTAKNAIYSDDLLTNGTPNPLTLELTDNDEFSEVVFEFSSPTIDENSSTTVTLTASTVSGAEVTIPFTLTQDDLSAVLDEEYIIVDDVRQIVIPANGNSASITISTEGLDDTVVELQEPITFTFGDIVNATTETSEATLFIVSDDDPNFTGITVSKNEFAEHESTTVTASIDVPASRDVNVNLTFTGTATNNLDYSASFDNEGKKSLIKNIGNENYGAMEVLPDGRFIFLRERTLRIYDPEDDSTIEKELSNYYWQNRGLVVLNNNILYAGNGNNMYEIDITNIDAISETSYINFQNNTSFEHHFSLSGNTLIYQVYDGNDSSNNRKVFRKIGDADPELIYQGDSCCYAHIMLGDKIYAIGDYQMFELIDGEYVNERYYNTRLNSQRTIVYNNEIYSIASDSNTIVKLVMSEEEYVDGDGNPGGGTFYNVTFEPLPISEDKQTQYFNFNSIGNLVAQNYVYENGDNNYELSEYQIIPQVTILAGETSGSLTLNGIEDDLNSPGEEEDETIVLNFQTPTRAVLTSDDLIDDITLTLLNNEIDLVEDVAALVNVPALSFSSVAWGDYDRDGDQDMAIMGRGIQDGVITRLYENVEGVFVNNNPDAFDSRYDGDLIWVDYNKDGYIDLIVSGLDNNDNPATTIYENQEGIFVPSTDLFLPNLFGTSMDSGDLDNDGDIDFVINGMEIVNGVNTWRKYIYLREGNTLVKEEDFNNQFNSDNGVKNGSVIIADNQFDGDLDIIIVGETGSKNQVNTLIDSNPCQYYWQCDNYITNLNFSSTALFGNFIYYMGQRDNNDGDIKIYRRSLLSNSEQELSDIDGLIKGSIAVADYNNDGKPDMLLTGENEDAESITKLYDGLNDGSSFRENTEVNLLGLRNSTAKWVDYDVDGDLDLFISGTSDEGEFTKLYRTDLLNKTNTPSSVVTGLLFEDLGYGKVKLSWEAPNDDFSSNLGYIIRLATSEGGSEISNTESNLETGQRLITKSPVIYNNSYETLLDPGIYYWAVQSVDDGLKGSQFSEENSFTLTYEWKELNQGGIIDRSINAVGKPIVKLTDIDFDNDMDLIYGSKDNNNDIQVFKLGSKKFLFEENINNSRNISDIKFYDFNLDKIQDILINTWDKNSSQGSFKLYNTSENNNQIFNEVFSAAGLFQSKVELIDINNDGLKEVVHIGRTNAESNSQLKVHVYEQENGALNPNFTDISAQFGLLKSGSFAFGNADGDSDIDFAITGLTNQGITSNLYENETLSTEIIDPVFTETSTEFPSAEDSTLDFFDYDGDGDLDIAITGQGIAGPMFKILSNNGLTGSDLEFEEVPNTGLIPIREANLDFGDYNSDGYTDILYSGKVSGQGQVTKLVEFDPNTQTYVDSDFDLSDIINASIAFGDIDGDNDLDFAIAGESVSNSGESIIKTYLNLRDESAAVLEDESGRVTTQEQFVVNQRPSKPTELTSEILGYNGDSNTYKVKFSWNSGTDESTPKAGLTNALKIVTSDTGKDIMTINSLENGYRLSAGKGNVEHETEWIINLPDLPDNESYSWTVQTIDAAFSGSEFAESKELDVDLVKLGDSNGDFDVTVLDLVTDVDYILGNDPNPFVFEAADVNNDESINVLDITATVDIILNPDTTNSRATAGSVNYYPSSAVGSAFFTWEGNELYVESEHNIGGIQLSFDTDFEYQLSSDLISVESLDFADGNSRSLMLYSFNNTIIANSKTKLLTKTGNSTSIYEDKIIVGTINGEKLNGFLKSTDIENQEFELFNLYPNPSDGLVNLEYFLPTQMDVVNLNIYDMQGRLVWSQELGKSSGIISNQLNLNKLSLGNYILSMQAYKKGKLKHVANKRLIIK